MNGPYVILAPIQLKDGFDEGALIKASDVFQDSFVSRQQGVLKRLLLRAKDGSHADLVFFESRQAADRVVEAELRSEACLDYFKIMQMPEDASPDMGALGFEHLKTYE